jgi:hypothetical protein
MRYTAFEIGRGGPTGDRPSMYSLCDRWNEALRHTGHDVAIGSAWGATGNFVVTSAESVPVGDMARLLDPLPDARGFVVFSESDFLSWFPRLETYIERSPRPEVAANRRPNPGAVMNRNPSAGIPPHLPAPDPSTGPAEDTGAWTSTDFAVARVRGVWKNDVMRSDGMALDTARRDGTWGAVSRAMARAYGGEWTARAMSTLRGLARVLTTSTPEGFPATERRDIARWVEENREAILRIAERHGAMNVRIFGSVARNAATATSDLDLLVDPGPNRSPFFPGGLIADLERHLGLRVDVLTENALHWYIRERVVREAVPL